MSKIIIDNHLIDLEMVTHISGPIVKNLEVEFTIHLIGPSEITITRFFGFNYTALTPEPARTIGKKLREDCIDAVQKMHNALTARWSPSMQKFDNLTVMPETCPKESEEIDYEDYD